MCAATTQHEKGPSKRCCTRWVAVCAGLPAQGQHPQMQAATVVAAADGAAGGVGGNGEAVGLIAAPQGKSDEAAAIAAPAARAAATETLGELFVCCSRWPSQCQAFF